MGAKFGYSVRREYDWWHKQFFLLNWYSDLYVVGLCVQQQCKFIQFEIVLTPFSFLIQQF
jgi:hypothetical protein